MQCNFCNLSFFFPDSVLFSFVVTSDVEDLRAALNECNQRVKELTLKLDNFDDVSAFQVFLSQRFYILYILYFLFDLHNTITVVYPQGHFILRYFVELDLNLKLFLGLILKKKTTLLTNSTFLLIKCHP